MWSCGGVCVWSLFFPNTTPPPKTQVRLPIENYEIELILNRFHSRDNVFFKFFKKTQKQNDTTIENNYDDEIELILNLQITVSQSRQRVFFKFFKNKKQKD